MCKYKMYTVYTYQQNEPTKLTVLPLEICEMEIKGRREGRERYAINSYKLSFKKRQTIHRIWDRI